MNVLEFLEQVGQDWQLRHAQPAQLAHAMDEAGIAPSWQAAVLDPDSRGLQALLELPATVCCAVHPAHEDDDDLDEDFHDDDEFEGDVSFGQDEDEDD